MKVEKLQRYLSKEATDLFYDLLAEYCLLSQNGRDYELVNAGQQNGFAQVEDRQHTASEETESALVASDLFGSLQKCNWTYARKNFIETEMYNLFPEALEKCTELANLKSVKMFAPAPHGKRLYRTPV